MNYRKHSRGLGLFSLALGAAELLAARPIARALDAEGHEGLIRGFGVREVAAGAVILARPDAAVGLWSRVAGDVMDIAAAGAATRHSPRNAITWGALAFVAGAALLDAWAARGLQEETRQLLRADLAPA